MLPVQCIILLWNNPDGFPTYLAGPESAVYECRDDVCGGRDFGGEFLFGELPAADVLDDFGVWECDKGEGE